MISHEPVLRPIRPSARLAALTLALLVIARPAPAAPGSPVGGDPGSAPDPRILSGGRYLASLPTSSVHVRARLGAASPLKGQPPTLLDPRVGPNVRLGDDPSELPALQRSQAEPHLIRSSVRPNVVLATFQEGRFAQGGGGVSCGYAVSRDGGASWTRALIPGLTRANGGPFLRATDPVAGAGPDGELYLNTLGSIDDGFGLAAVLVSRSVDDGTTWSAPSVVFRSTTQQISPDKNWLAVNDHAGSPTRGRLACTWTLFTIGAPGLPYGNHLVCSISDDRGTTWSPPVEITPPGSSNQGSQPMFLPDGSLVVIYANFPEGGGSRFSVEGKVSPDGGRSFPRSATVIAASVETSSDAEMRWGSFLPSATRARQSGDLYVTYVGGVLQPAVMVQRSSDGGATWSAPVKVSDQPAGVSVMNATVAASGDGTTVSVVFMDKRNAPAGRGLVDLYLAQSFDRGASWQPNLRLSDYSSPLAYAPLTPTGYMLGDYLGILPPVQAGQPGLAIWCDTREGNGDPHVVSFATRPVADWESWAVARRLPSSAGLADLGADTDGDGEANYTEYLAGTEPGRSESGEALLVRASSTNTVDVFWTERRTAPRIPGIADGIAAALASASPTFSASPVIRNELAAGEFPAIVPPPGLTWAAARFVVTPGTAVSFARALVAGTAQPTTAASRPATVGTTGRLTNLSTRATAGPAAGQLIVGWVVEGRKPLLVRAAGPSLVPLGVNNALADPRLTVTGPGGSPVLGTNDNWSDGTASAALFARLGAFPFNRGSLDAALDLTLAAGAYSAVISGGTPQPGIALVEAYDADPVTGSASTGRLVNLSSRGAVAPGEGALIAGFALSGIQPRRVLVRAIGPTLAGFGVDGALTDPVLTLYRDGVAVATNDDWQISRSPAVLAAAAAQLGAFPLRAASLDAALLVTLPPGSYTVAVTSADGAGGIALVEIYDAG